MDGLQQRQPQGQQLKKGDWKYSIECRRGLCDVSNTEDSAYTGERCLSARIVLFDTYGLLEGIAKTAL